MRTRTGALSAVVGVLLTLVTACGVGEPQAVSCPDDALAQRALSEQREFTGWLADQQVDGTFGEVGWPDGPEAGRWNALASCWFAAADAAGVPTYVWGAAEQWSPTYPLAIYRRAAADGPDAGMDTAGRQADVLASRANPGGLLRGVAAADGSFGAAQLETGPYSSTSPGTYGQDYRYPSEDSLTYLAAQGVQTIRLAVTWERLQPTLGGELDGEEVSRVLQVLDAAQRQNLSVLLDVHSYARYARGESDGSVTVLRLGGPGLGPDELADLWTRLAGVVAGRVALAGYGLMNEPHDLPGGAATWEVASQRAVDAVRRVDRATPVVVAGYGYSSAGEWTTNHPRAWIEDPADRVVYEAHQYFDADRSGTYPRTYQAELDRAGGA